MQSFFPREALDEIWNLIGSVSEGFPTYFYCDIAAQIFLNKFHMSCKDLIAPKVYISSRVKKNKKNGMCNVYIQLLRTF